MPSYAKLKHRAIRSQHHVHTDKVVDMVVVVVEDNTVWAGPRAVVDVVDMMDTAATQGIFLRPLCNKLSGHNSLQKYRPSLVKALLA
jgi:hypothetical protein